jgi:hypothetical protein
MLKKVEKRTKRAIHYHTSPPNFPNTSYTPQTTEEGQKEEVVPGVEPGSPESESGVITTTLHNRFADLITIHREI